MKIDLAVEQGRNRSVQRRPAMSATHAERPEDIRGAAFIAVLVSVALLGPVQRPPISPLNLTYLLYPIVIAFSWHVGRNFRGNRRRMWRFEDSATTVLVIATAVGAAAYAVAYGADSVRWSILLNTQGIFLLYFVSRFALVGMRSCEVLLRGVVAGGSLYSIVSLLLFLGSSSMGPALQEEDELRVADALSFDEGLRLAGLAGNPNGFAAVCLLMIPLGMYFAMFEKSVRRRIVFFVGTGAMMIGTVLSLSRSAWAGFVVSVLFVSISGGSKRVSVRLFKVLAAGLVLLGVYYLADTVLGPMFANRLRTVREEESYGSRKDIWRHGLQIAANNPLGVGAGNFREASARTASGAPFWVLGRSSHNSFLNTAVEAGVAGGAAFVLLAWAVVFGRRRRRLGGSTARRTLDVRVFASAGFLGFFIHCLFHSVHMQMYVWALMAASVSVSELVDSGEQSRVRPSMASRG